ncbi:MAG: hypothetical protein JWR44_3600 [Hymenobacter sp.]|jgi:hypothetical protein|nr:hypothetical protein [Hymenobacter sp.]
MRNRTWFLMIPALSFASAMLQSYPAYADTFIDGRLLKTTGVVFKIN